MRLPRHALVFAGVLLSFGIVARASTITYNFSGEFYNQYAKYSTKPVPAYYEVNGWVTANLSAWKVDAFNFTLTAKNNSGFDPHTISTSAPKGSKFVGNYFPFSPKEFNFVAGEYNTLGQNLYLEFDNGVPGTADSESDFGWGGEYWYLDSGGALTPAPASPVPEPASGVLLLTGVLLLGLGLGWHHRRRAMAAALSLAS